MFVCSRAARSDYQQTTVPNNLALNNGGFTRKFTLRYSWVLEGILLQINWISRYFFSVNPIHTQCMLHLPLKTTQFLWVKIANFPKKKGSSRLPTPNPFGIRWFWMLLPRSKTLPKLNIPWFAGIMCVNDGNIAHLLLIPHKSHKSHINVNHIRLVPIGTHSKLTLWWNIDLPRATNCNLNQQKFQW